MALKKGVLLHLGGLLNEAFDYDTYFAKLGTTGSMSLFCQPSFRRYEPQSFTKTGSGRTQTQVQTTQNGEHFRTQVR